jgi:hypothetical protein
VDIWPREQVIASIEARTNTFLVNDPLSGKRAVREVGKVPYLRAYADGYCNDDLLSMDQRPMP